MTDASVNLRIPADPSYVALARAAVAAVCARLDFPLDRLDDLALAVDEACSLLIADAEPGAQVSIVLEPLQGNDLQIAVTAATARGRLPQPNSFSWMVLTALVDSVTADVGEGNEISFRMRAAAYGPDLAAPS